MGFRPKHSNVTSHIAFVVDESDSMRYAGLTESVKEQILAQIETMAGDNVEKTHEIRGTLYTFQGQRYCRDRDQHVHCVFSDMDILRMQEALKDPNLSDWYEPGGMTALIDATMKAIEEMEEYPTRYGKHSYLIWVVSDGLENASVTDAMVLKKKLTDLPDNWMVGVLVPDANAKHAALKLGFREENVLIWDATSKAGLEKASQMMATATSTVLRGHRTGTRQTGGLFSTGADAVNREAIQQVGLKPLPPTEFERHYAYQKMRCDELAREKSALPYKRGTCFYQLTKRELIQGHKKLAVWDKEKEVLYYGDGVRELVGLTTARDEKVTPQENDRYEIYVQSGADNRVIPETKHMVVIPAAS